MKITKSDFGVMRSSLITLTIAICCSLLLIYFSDRQASIAERNWNAAQQRLSTAQNDLNNARWDYENLFKYQDEYAASLDRNLIGDEPRLDWATGTRSGAPSSGGRWCCRRARRAPTSGR